MDALSLRAHRVSGPELLLVAALILGGVTIAHFGWSWSFFYDEWGTIFFRRSGGIDAFLAPHNDHLQPTVIAVYRVLFPIFGLRTYHPYQLVAIAAHLTLVGLVFAYAKQRIGTWAALLAVLPLLVLAYAWQILFWAFEMGFTFSLIALLAILMSNRPAVVAGATALALASSGVGVAVAAAAVVLAVLSRDRVRRLVAVGVPVGFYALWWLLVRPSVLPPAALRHLPGANPEGDVGVVHLPASSIPRVPSYIAHSAKAAANSLVAVDPAGSWLPLVALMLVLGGVVIARRSRLTPWLAALCVALLVFWLEVAATRQQLVAPGSPGANRYLYPGAVLLTLIVVEALNGIRPAPLVLAALCIGVLAIVVADVRAMQRFGRDTSAAIRRESAVLRGLQCRRRVDPHFSPGPGLAPGVTAGPYLAAVRALGSPPGQACRQLHPTHT